MGNSTIVLLCDYAVIDAVCHKRAACQNSTGVDTSFAGIQRTPVDP